MAIKPGLKPKRASPEKSHMYKVQLTRSCMLHSLAVLTLGLEGTVHYSTVLSATDACTRYLGSVSTVDYTKQALECLAKSLLEWCQGGHRFAVAAATVKWTCTSIYRSRQISLLQTGTFFQLLAVKPSFQVDSLHDMHGIWLALTGERWPHLVLLEW